MIWYGAVGDRSGETVRRLPDIPEQEVGDWKNGESHRAAKSSQLPGMLEGDAAGFLEELDVGVEEKGELVWLQDST